MDGFKSCKAEDIKGVKCFPVENGHEYKIEIANHRLGAVMVCQEETWAARY